MTLYISSVCIFEWRISPSQHEAGIIKSYFCFLLETLKTDRLITCNITVCVHVCACMCVFVQTFLHISAIYLKNSDENVSWFLIIQETQDRMNQKHLKMSKEEGDPKLFLVQHGVFQPFCEGEVREGRIFLPGLFEKHSVFWGLTLHSQDLSPLFPSRNRNLPDHNLHTPLIEASPAQS